MTVTHAIVGVWIKFVKFVVRWILLPRPIEMSPSTISIAMSKLT
jgi:hypothetical protein